MRLVSGVCNDVLWQGQKFVGDVTRPSVGGFDFDFALDFGQLQSPLASDLCFDCDIAKVGDSFIVTTP
jgi:hypothetical protein